MSGKVLVRYLNDHLAGSVMALELLDHLIKLRQGAERELLVQLQAEIREDQDVLKQYLQGVGGTESPVRKAAAWLTEKLGRAKLKLDDTGSDELRMLEALEALALGIQGKLGLWRSLASAGKGTSQYSGVDLNRLQARAQDQFNRVDQLRLQVAARALGS
jgi:hypothetical protein